MRFSVRLALAALSLALLAECSFTPPISPPQRSERAANVVMLALSLQNTNYRFGGKTPRAGIDCSGLVTYVFKHAIGMRLNGNAATLARQGRKVARDRIRPGDLVFFNTRGHPFSHVGIYIGNHEFIHAPNSRGVVRIDKLTNPYYAARFETARTVLD
jgi:cell wall-associated NlpC family hydrolase